MTVLGIDVYSGNGHVDFVKARDEDGVRFVIRKASEGVTYQDPGFAQDFDRIVAAGLIPGAYHFAHPARNTPAAEARNFLNVLGARRGCLLALDFEDTRDNLTLWQRAAWVSPFLSIVHQATGIGPLLYTYHSWAFSSAFAGIRTTTPLWIPLGQGDPIDQATHMLGTLGVLDVDTFNGTENQLRALAGLAPAPPGSVFGKETDMFIARRGSDGAEALIRGDKADHIPATSDVEALKRAGVGVADPLSDDFYAALTTP